MRAAAAAPLVNLPSQEGHRSCLAPAAAPVATLLWLRARMVALRRLHSPVARPTPPPASLLCWSASQAPQRCLLLRLRSHRHNLRTTTQLPRHWSTRHLTACRPRSRQRVIHWMWLGLQRSSGLAWGTTQTAWRLPTLPPHSCLMRHPTLPRHRPQPPRGVLGPVTGAPTLAWWVH